MVEDRRFFFGRTRETRRALQMLRSGQCVSIVGPRRIGKTSLLFHLCDPEVQKGHNLGDDYCFIYIDCQGLRDLDKSEFYQWLWKETKRALLEQGEADDWTESTADFKEFYDAMMTIQGEGHKPVFLFDEFESIAIHPNLDQNLFSDLRSLVPIVIYATASRDSLYDLTYAERSVLSSPFFNTFLEVDLGFMKPNEAEGKPHEAEEMVLGLLRMTGQENLFTEEDFAFVFGAGGYHPFFLQLACYHLFEWKMDRKELAAADYESVQQQYTDDAEPHFRYAWEHLGVDEKKAIQLVCEGKVSQVDDEQRRQLERKCILHNNAIFSSVFAEFVHRQTTEGVAEKAHEAEAKGETREQVALDALLIAFFFGGLFAMVLALLSNYSPLFWLAGFLVLAFIILLLIRFIILPLVQSVRSRRS
jgi:hypothetical protein